VDARARLMDESIRPLDLDDLADDSAPDDPDALDEQPELSAEDLEGIGRMFEERWLDQALPVLGGETPREAARSARRDDLIALLDDFEWEQKRTQSPITMDALRLRHELGLDG
jgi:hypothetical protein